MSWIPGWGTHCNTQPKLQLHGPDERGPSRAPPPPRGHESPRRRGGCPPPPGPPPSSHPQLAVALKGLLQVPRADRAGVKPGHKERLVGDGRVAAGLLPLPHVGVILGKLHAQAAAQAAPLAAAGRKGRKGAGRRQGRCSRLERVEVRPPGGQGGARGGSGTKKSPPLSKQPRPTTTAAPPQPQRPCPPSHGAPRPRVKPHSPHSPPPLTCRGRGWHPPHPSSQSSARSRTL